MRSVCLLLTALLLVCACNRAGGLDDGTAQAWSNAPTRANETGADSPRSITVDAQTYLALLAAAPSPTAPRLDAIVGSVIIDAPVDPSVMHDRFALRAVRVGEGIWLERSGGVGGTNAWIGPMAVDEAAARLRLAPEALIASLTPDA